MLPYGLRCLSHFKPVFVLYTPSVGYALNAAIAAVLARPAPAGAVVLAGDGGFQMSLQELPTFQQMRRPGDGDELRLVLAP
jgi:TPP-dependent 2-oxoacid decarboxylase